MGFLDRILGRRDDLPPVTTRAEVRARLQASPLAPHTEAILARSRDSIRL